MLNLASSLGCSGPTDVACLCTNDDFGFGIRDCTAEACPPNADRSSVIDFGNMYCESKSSIHPSGAQTLTSTRIDLASGGSGTTTAVATTGTNTVVVSTGPSTTVTASSDSGSGGVVVGGGSVVTTTDDSGSPSTTTIAPTSTDGSSTGGSLVGSNSTSSTNGTSPSVGGAPFTNGTSSTGNSTSGGAESSSGTATGTVSFHPLRSRAILGLLTTFTRARRVVLHLPAALRAPNPQAAPRELRKPTPLPTPSQPRRDLVLILTMSLPRGFLVSLVLPLWSFCEIRKVVPLAPRALFF